MDIKDSYVNIAPFFNIWVTAVESGARMMEVRDFHIPRAKILIISPPTDSGIRMLAKANSDGEIFLLCFSARIEMIAKKYLERNKIENVRTLVEDFFHLPFENGYFDAVFANCFFDFCRKDDFNTIIFEIKKTLKSKGALFSVNRGAANGFFSNTWRIIFRKLPFLNQGCRPVDIKPALLRNKFCLRQDIALMKFGFPIEYIQAEKMT